MSRVSSRAARQERAKGQFPSPETRLVDTKLATYTVTSHFQHSQLLSITSYSTITTQSTPSLNKTEVVDWFRAG